MHTSLKLLVIVVIFIEHGLTISFIPVTIFVSLETWGLYLIIREISKSYFSHRILLLSGVPDYFGRNKISSGGDLSHYSSASLY